MELSLGPASIDPDVRFWVDLGFNGPLRDETELSLKLERRWCWSGTLLVDRETPFFYRLGICAPEGTGWSLRIHDSVRGVQLLADEDWSAMPKCWLLGTYSPPRSQERTQFAPCSLRMHAGDSPERGKRQPSRGATVLVLSQHRLRRESTADPSC